MIETLCGVGQLVASLDLDLAFQIAVGNIQSALTQPLELLGEEGAEAKAKDRHQGHADDGNQDVPKQGLRQLLLYGQGRKTEL